MALDFKQSKPLTVGVELELQLINNSNFDLSRSSPDLIYLLKRNQFSGTVTPEMTESMIEICTSVHSNYIDLLEQLSHIKDQLIAACKQLNIGICGGGTHPFQKWHERKIFSKERFEKLSHLYGYLAKQFTIFGQHIHIGCDSGDNALYLLHALNKYVPHFIALSASSPFIQGVDTLFSSSRLNSVFAFPLSGNAPYILKWKEFEQYFAKMQDTTIVKTMKDFYWDIRPKPEYGTIELRVCDTPLTVKKASALAAYLQTLCMYLLENQETNHSNAEDYLVYNYNRFQACRFGLDAKIIHPKTHICENINEVIIQTLNQLSPYAETLGTKDALAYLFECTNSGNDADTLRAQYEKQNNLDHMVQYALDQFNL